MAAPRKNTKAKRSKSSLVASTDEILSKTEFRRNLES